MPADAEQPSRATDGGRSTATNGADGDGSKAGGSATGTGPTVVTYVEMRSRPAPPRPAPVVIGEARRPNPALNRALYSMVGADYRWADRLSWTDEQWEAVVWAEGYQTWLGYVDGSPIGYVEIDARDPVEVEIAYFGLLPPFVGQGLGRPFLARAIEAAWADEATGRVWLHTCTDDHPRALPNYLAAGFVIYDEQVE